MCTRHAAGVAHYALFSLACSGVALKDLTFIEDGNPDFVRGLINFAKRRMLYRVISETLLYQDQEYQITPQGVVSELAASIPPVNEKEIYNQSLQREPRDADKDQLVP